MVAPSVSHSFLMTGTLKSGHAKCLTPFLSSVPDKSGTLDIGYIKITFVESEKQF
jgi:hypothetical protein